MADLEVVVAGYVRDGGDVEHVQGTVTLIRDSDRIIVVDPGIMQSQSVLQHPLNARGIAATDVTHVFVTHHHIDHTRNIGMFPNATVVDGQSVYAGDVWSDHDATPYAFSDDITVLSTPGHSQECATWLVNTSDKGMVALTHAWWFADMSPKEDPLAFDQNQLNKSREEILRVADFIVPGHGHPFLNPRKRL